MAQPAADDIRRATPDDAEACHELLWESVTDFGARHGTSLTGPAEEWRASSGSLQRFLAERAFPAGCGDAP